MPNRRKRRRKATRLRVKFWVPGKPDVDAVGYTTNVSASGCFLQTERPAPTGTRLQMEFTSEKSGFVCEGLVARSIKSPYELRQVKPSGMGIRFCTPEELLRNITSASLSSEVSVVGALSTNRSEQFANAGLPETTATANQSEKTPRVEAHSSASRRIARAHPAAAPRRKETKPDTAQSSEPVAAFRIAPTSLVHLDKIYRSELANGCLFIPTDKSYPQGSKVRIEIVLPGTDISIDLLATVAGEDSQTPSAVPSSTSRVGLSLVFDSPTNAAKTISSFLTENA